MGKCRTGLRAWWEGVVESAQDNARVVIKSTVKAASSCLVGGSRSVGKKSWTERESEFLLGLVCWAFIAIAVAAVWEILPEFLLGILTGIAITAAWARMMERRSQQRSTIASNVELLGGIRRESAGYEQVEWANRLLKKAWPYIASATEDALPSIRDRIEPFLEEHRLAAYEVIREQPDTQRVEKYIPVEEVISSIYVNGISPGSIAPTIQGLKIHELAEGKVVCNARLVWQSDAQVTLGVGTVTGIVPVVVENVNIIATVRVTLRITESPPFVAAVVLTFPAERKPIVDFTLSVIETSTTVLPIVNKQLREIVSDIIPHALLCPHRLVLPTISPLPKGLDLSQLYLRLQGQLSVVIIKGEKLVNLYPYVMIYCRPKIKLRTKSVENTHDPIWNEEFTLDVEDQNSQSLVLQVMNENKGADEVLGMAVYPLKDLPVDQDVQIELNVQPRNKSYNGGEGVVKKSCGSLSLELRYHVYTDSEQQDAMQAEQRLMEALAIPDKADSYTTAMDLIHPW